MGEAQVGTRGEFNRTFAPGEVRERESGWTFVCPTSQQFVMLLKKGNVTAINGEVIKTEDKVARFEDFTFHTEDQEIADLIRTRQPFKQGTVVELSALKAAAREKQVADEAKRLSDDPELLKAAVEKIKTLRPGKTAAPEVSK